MGESLSAKYSYGIGGGAHNPCVGRQTYHLGLALAVDGRGNPYELGLALALDGRVATPSASKLGLHLACKGYVPEPLPEKIGLHLACEGYAIPPWALAEKIGLHLACEGLTLTPPTGDSRIGLHLALGGYGKSAPFDEIGKLGLHLAVDGLTLSPPVEISRLGLHLSVGKETKWPPEEVSKLGLHVAVGGHTDSPSVEVSKLGLHVSVGGTGVYEAPPPSGGGSDCAHALFLAPGTYGPFTLSTGEHWYEFASAAFTTNHIRYTLTSGSGPQFWVYQGTSCAGLATRVNTSFSLCHDVFVGFTTRFFFRVQAPLSGSITYTIEIGSGSCSGGGGP